MHSIVFSENGWTDQELGMEWLEKVFEPLTAEQDTSGCHQLLILNGHNSHCTFKFASYAKAHNVIVLCLHPLI
jgi:DDE superfamily endonuclease